MLRVLQLQTKVFKEKEDTFYYIEKYMEKLKSHRPDLVTLPEMFNCPYENKAFSLYAEKENGKTYKFCQDLARKYHIYLSAGSIPEIDEKNRLFNTAYVFDQQGMCIAKHRKMHLFDIDVQGGQQFKESDTLTAGNKITVFDTLWGKMGLCVCYDLRFPEIIRIMVMQGVKVIIVPAAFNMTTGPLHWELLFRSRAVDNQVFTIGTAPAQDLSVIYHSYGHSIVVSPWGNVLNQLSINEGFICTDIDLTEVDKVREQLPLLKHRRVDIYKLQQNN